VEIGPFSHRKKWHQILLEMKSTKRKRLLGVNDEANSERGRMMEDRWLSVNEIADHLCIKRDTVYKWISERQMPGHKIGRLWKFNKKEVDEWVKSGAAGEKDNEDPNPTKDRSK